MDKVDIVIIGAGVIGLAIARHLAIHHPGKSIVVIEKEKLSGLGISSRSSEVIHGGLYYPKNYLKSLLCVRGREQLYQYCREHQIPHQQIGKIVVAQTDEEHEFLHALALRAELNGVDDLRWLRRSTLAALEPAVHARGAFLSPSSGIVDSVALMRSLEKDALEHGVTFAFFTVVQKIEVEKNGFTVALDRGEKLQSRILINAAGLQAVSLARTMTGLPTNMLPTLQMAKGNYFSYSGKSPFRHLIYPVPAGQPMTSPNAQHTGLGIHATIDLQGHLRFGPDVEMVDAECYGVDEKRKPAFVTAIRRYFPALDEDKLHASYAGIRPRLFTFNTKTPDFMIQTEQIHGQVGLVNLFGMESPGITACLAIADQVSLGLFSHLE